MAGVGSIEYMIGLINSLQLIIHLPIMYIILPGNVALFFSIILPFVMFDFLETEYTTEVVFTFDYDGQERLNYKILDQMKDLGYRTHNSMLNLGSLFIFVVLYFLKVMLLPFFALGVMLSGKGEKTYQSLKDQLFFKEIIILLIEGCMEFMISGYLNIQEPLRGTSFIGEELSFWVAWFSFIKIMVVLPLAFFYMLQQPLARLESSSF